MCHFIWPLCYISLCTFQTNTGTLELLSCICKYANERTEKVIVFYQKKEVYLRLFYLLRSKRLLYKCTEINAINFLYSHFFFFLLLMEMFVLFYHCLL